MQTHKLTAADDWFIKKGQIDSISRSPFQIGDEVVVCDKQHVMLAEFYDGECPSCHSQETVPFSRQSVEVGTLRRYAGECPLCAAKLTVLLRQHGTDSPFVGRCPQCNQDFSLSAMFFEEQALREKFKKHIGRVNTVLGWTLGLLIAGVIIFSLAGVVPNGRFVLYAQNVMWPKTFLLISRIPDFIISEKFNESFVAFNGLIANRTGSLLIKGAAVLSALGSGVLKTCVVIWNRSIIILMNSGGLLKRLIYKTKLLFEWIRKWVSSFAGRFT